MKATYFAATAIAALALSGTAHASVDFILGQGADGKVYSIDVTDASASVFQDLSDFNTDPTEADNSPNALGFNGSSFRSDFPEDNNINTLYRNDTALFTYDTGSGNASGVAAGDVVGDVYHFIDRDGFYNTITGINGSPGTQGFTQSDRIDLGLGGPFGDLAIRGDDLFVSYGNSFSIFDLTDLSLSPTTFALQRFAGLAFAHGDLYGVTGGQGATSELWSIDFLNGTDTLVGNTGVALTDAATVPLPAAAWLMIGGLGAVGAAARHGRRKRVGASA